VNGKEAVDIVSSNTGIQLVLMDIKMPVMNGIQATKEIKQIRPELPVIATSAFAMPGDKQIFKDAGCEDYLSKPVKADLLISLIRKYI
jgi:CheY-like chemotaxis protein